MVKRCVVQFCTDSNKTGHTMQRFPNEANLKQQRVKFAQVKGAHFVEPFQHFVDCSSHFSPDCDEKSYMVEMGLKMKKQLLPSAVQMIKALPEANNSEVKRDPYSRQTERIRKWPTALAKNRGEVKLFKS